MATTRPHQSQICTTEASTQSPELIEAILDGGSDFTRHPVARFRNSSPLSFEDTQEGFFFFSDDGHVSLQRADQVSQGVRQKLNQENSQFLK